MSAAVGTDRQEAIPGLFQDGRPDPRYPASLGILPARPRQRSAAFAIDLGIVVVLVLPIVLGTVPRWLSLDADELQLPFDQPAFMSGLIFFAVGQGLMTVYAVVQLLLHGLVGRTIGKSIMGIRSVNARSLAKPGFWRILVRAVVFALACTVIPILGAVPVLLSPLWDIEKRGRGWLDHIGGNWLTDVRRGLDPFDAVALRRARRALDTPADDARVQVPSLATGSPVLTRSHLAARSRSGVVGASARTSSSPSLGIDPARAGRARASAVPPVVIAAPPQLRMSPAGPVSALIQADDGARYVISGTTLVGRDPEGSLEEGDVRGVSIRDGSRSISKTHASIRVTEEGVVVEDRGSSNGTALLGTDGRWLVLEPSAPASAGWGQSIRLGDRVFVVGRASEGTDAG